MSRHEGQELEPLSSDLFCLRGVGILLVVLVHVLGVDAQHGVRKLYPASRADLRVAFEFIHTFNMAVMMMASGVVAAAFGRSDSALREMLHKKWSKLIFPMLVWAPALLLMRTLATDAPHTWGDGLTLLGKLPTAWFPPYAIFWFVHALVGCSLLLWLFQRFIPGRSASGSGWLYWGLALPLGMAMNVWKLHGGGPAVEYLALILYWNVFFGLGYALPPVLRAARGWFSSRSRQVLVTVGCLILITTVYGVLSPEHYEVACLLNGPLGFCMLFSFGLLLRDQTRALEGPWRVVWRQLVSLGSISMTMYLLHLFFTSGIRMMLRHWNPLTPLWVHLVLGFIAGCVGPWWLFGVIQKRPGLHVLIGYSPRVPAQRPEQPAPNLQGLG